MRQWIGVVCAAAVGVLLSEGLREASSRLLPILARFQPAAPPHDLTWAQWGLVLATVASVTLVLAVGRRVVAVSAVIAALGLVLQAAAPLVGSTAGLVLACLLPIGMLAASGAAIGTLTWLIARAESSDSRLTALGVPIALSLPPAVIPVYVAWDAFCSGQVSCPGWLDSGGYMLLVGAVVPVILGLLAWRLCSGHTGSSLIAASAFGGLTSLSQSYGWALAAWQIAAAVGTAFALASREARRGHPG